MSVPHTATFYTYLSDHPDVHKLGAMKNPVRFVDEKRGANPQDWKYSHFFDLNKLLPFRERALQNGGPGLNWDRLEDVQWMDPPPALWYTDYANETRQLLQHARAPLPPVETMEEDPIPHFGNLALQPADVAQPSAAEQLRRNAMERSARREAAFSAAAQRLNMERAALQQADSIHAAREQAVMAMQSASGGKRRGPDYDLDFDSSKRRY